MVSTQRDWCAAKQCLEMFEKKEKQSIKDHNRNGDEQNMLEVCSATWMATNSTG